MRTFYAGLALVIVFPFATISGCKPDVDTRRQPDTKSVSSTLGNAAQKLRESDRRNALALYQRVLILDANNITARANRAVLLSLDNNATAAINDITRVRQQQAAVLRSRLQKAPKNAALLLEYSQNQSSLGQHPQAIETAQQAVNITPTAQSYFVLANAYYRSANYTSALTNYNKAIGLQPDMLRAYLARAVNKQKLGDHAGAAQDFQKVNTLYPEDDLFNSKRR